MFKFKKFTIFQEQTSMKVCTDSCIFGSLIEIEEKTTHILDIGTGTGLLALMQAQKKSSTHIIGIEIESMAAQEATSNVKNSNYNSQITIINDSLQNYLTHAKTKFELIICNPPFYENQLLSPKKGKNIAHHSLALTFDELCQGSSTLLAEHGSFWVLLPIKEMSNFVEIAKKYDFLVQNMISIKHNPLKVEFRKIAQFKKEKLFVQKNEEICIYETDSKTYSQRFVNLLSDYYLNF